MKGSKKWILSKSSKPPPGVYPSKDQSEVVSPVSVVEWYINHYKSIQPCNEILEATVNKGELIFIPANYWHSVLNLEDSIAITQNFCASFNLWNVLEFLKFRKDMVSGYTKNDLYNDFIKALLIHNPTALEGINLDELIDPTAQKVSKLWSELVPVKESFSFTFEE